MRPRLSTESSEQGEVEPADYTLEGMGLENWLDARKGIAHRTDALDAGFSDYAITKEIHNDRVHVVRREWLITRTCARELYTAAHRVG